jgi:hypothetical protein
MRNWAIVMPLRGMGCTIDIDSGGCAALHTRLFTLRH